MNWPPASQHDRHARTLGFHIIYICCIAPSNTKATAGDLEKETVQSAEHQIERTAKPRHWALHNTDIASIILKYRDIYIYITPQNIRGYCKAPELQCHARTRTVRLRLCGLSDYPHLWMRFKDHSTGILVSWARMPCNWIPEEQKGGVTLTLRAIVHIIRDRQKRKEL